MNGLALPDWSNKESYVLCNPRLSPSLQSEAHRLLTPLFPGHVWLATSGSTKAKWVALSKQAILASAHAVNQWIQSDSQDIWLLSLPTFHVGGLGILARAYLSSASVMFAPEKWNVHTFYQLLIDAKITLTSLVPAQLYDLRKENLPAPPSLRGVFLGGGALDADLNQWGEEKGWKLLPTYGMTEASSQIATVPLDTNRESMVLLPHLEGYIDTQERLCIRGSSLLTAYAQITDGSVEVFDPKVNGWFTTEDRCRLTQRTLTVLGRLQDWIKIGGENVNFRELESLFNPIKEQCVSQGDCALLPVPDERLGHAIFLVSDPQCKESEIIRLTEAFNARVMPYERIRFTRRLKAIERSPLGKLNRRAIIDALNALTGLQ